MFSVTIPVPTVLLYVAAVISITLIVKWVASWLTG